MSDPKENPRSLERMMVCVGVIGLPSIDNDQERAYRDMSHSVTAI